MPPASERLPPLDWVRVFEVAARTGSFVAAAELLSVSPGAVSRTVKELEQFLGIKLFRRLPRGVELTDTGRDYADRVAPAIQQIADASRRLSRQQQASVLRVTAMPALGERWLVPRLGRFRDEYPQISVEVSADSTVVDLPETNFDIALRYCAASAADSDYIPLFDDEIFPVAAPSFLARHAVGKYEDIFELPALQDKYWASDWDRWLAAAGVETRRELRTTSFTLYSMALSAAISGQGIIMGHRLLVQEELDSGRLAEPFDLRVRTDKQFGLLRNPARRMTPSVEAFIDWLQAQSA